MKKLFSLCMLMLSIGLYAQNPVPKIGTVQGKVMDATSGEAIPYATIVIKSKADSKVLTGAISDDNGNFKIEKVPAGALIIDIQFIGYETVSKEVTITNDAKVAELGTVSLAESATTLNEVEVVAERTTIEQKVDRKVITVGKDLVTAGPTASDIMNNLPSVNVDQQTGDISLRGNQNVRVMVDGKLSTIPTAQLLRQLPSNSIKKIELITNPSAKYNPEGMSGIINIVLRKNVNIGFNGNATIGVTREREAKFNSNLDMNYRNGKFNIFGNYGNNISKNRNGGNIFRPDENSEQFFDNLDNNKNHLIKFGIDVYLNDKNTVSFFTNQNLTDSRSEGFVNILFYEDAQFNNSQDFLAVNDNLASQYNFNYKYDITEEGENIELEVDYNVFDAENQFDFVFAGFNTFPDYIDESDTNRDRTTINLDYVRPLKNQAKLEAGAEARLFNSNIDYQSTGFSFDEFGDLRRTPSTDFDYSRDIYSIYATYGKQYEKWSYQVGLRAETVQVDANALSTEVETPDTENIIFENDYTQIYPSAFFTYSPSEKNSYQLSYSRRVDRPGIGQVNPIREWATPLITSFGNINLQPQFTNSMEMNYTRKLGNKGTFTGGVFYRIIEDEINRAVFVDRTDLNRIILTHDNFDNTTAYGFELSSNLRPTSWWSFNTSFDFFSQTQKGITESLNAPTDVATTDNIVRETREVDNQAWNFRMFNNFAVSKKLNLSAFGFYRGAVQGIQFKMEPMYFVNVGARYSFAEGKGTLSVNYNDIFRTMEFGFDGQRPFRQSGGFRWESNTVNVSISYRFGGGKYRAKSRKQRDNDEKSGSGGFL
ncbi:outer membrane protein beta-barrel family protein [Kordia sp. SMS9]|uniref:outer membrane beta-barrel family protein n=1 Tax=Kordia sp. SMS9 TaxID=2282170 RepID=UPI000E0D7F84|nr:outer membrane beta-barrel family protein [Kordia sp. SMS9]AXG70191.1 outer membrane protein beta-barrel family protein [Kordia sp. SMS9]